MERGAFEDGAIETSYELSPGVDAFATTSVQDPNVNIHGIQT